MSIRISIVIPFYNVEKYIAECLDSVFNQDIPEEEYEVICVNDASPDGSRDIVMAYKEKHPNLILVEHEVNKKLGAARNTGRRVARGQFIWNVDSDDMIVPNCLGAILSKCEKDYLDVLLFSFDTFKDGQRIGRDRPWIESTPCSGLRFWEHQLIPHLSEVAQVWTQVYRKSYLDEKRIFSPTINMSEDESYTFSSILQADRILAVPKPYYIARQHSASLSFAIKHHPSPVLLYEGGFQNGKELNRLLTHIPYSQRIIRKSVKGIVRYAITSHLSLAKQLTPQETKEFLSLCRRGFLQNLFVFSVLGRRQSISYLSFLVHG